MFYSLFIICACTVPKMTVKTGPAKTGPAGLLAMAMATEVSVTIGAQLYRWFPNVS